MLRRPHHPRVGQGCFREIFSTDSASFSCVRMAIHAQTIQNALTAIPTEKAIAANSSTGPPPLGTWKFGDASFSFFVLPFEGEIIGARCQRPYFSARAVIVFRRCG